MLACIRDRRQTLDLSRLRISRLPVIPSHAQVASIVSIDISRNSFRELPDALARFTNLQTLNARDNAIEIPEAFPTLPALLRLDLANNQLSQAPRISNLTKLHSLDLSANRIAQFDLSDANLRALQYLNLRSNEIRSITLDLEMVSSLVWLDLRDNSIEQLAIGAGKAPTLITIDLSGNRLTLLPDSICDLSSLRFLAADRNQLIALPRNIGSIATLETLRVGNNDLEGLPNSLTQLRRLTELELRGNSRLDLSPELLAAKPRIALTSYFSNRATSARPLRELKVLVVGNSGVGKTSLIKQLNGENFELTERPTHEIKRRVIFLDCGEPIGRVRLNIWDFGGQEMMHTTSQFFLSRRSLYILVLSSRLDEMQNRLKYWLAVISAFGSDSPVIVVCNKSDEHYLNISQESLNREFPQVKSVVNDVSCFQVDGVDKRRNIDRLFNSIKACVVQHVPGVMDRISESWFQLKKSIEDDFELGAADTISREDYHRRATEYNIPDEQRQALLERLHELGCILQFGEHVRIKESPENKNKTGDFLSLNVLRPNWVTAAIFGLINDLEIARKGGIFIRDDLRRILDELHDGRKRYPVTVERFILELLLQFEIGFPLDYPKGSWLLPDLLKRDPPDTGIWEGAARIRYQYAVLPQSIMVRLTVRMFRQIAPGCHWRSGIKFNFPNSPSTPAKCEVLVRCDTQPLHSFLEVLTRGGTVNERREAIAVVRNVLLEIHSDFGSSIGVEEHVPIPGHPAASIPYSVLKLLEEEGRKHFEIVWERKLIRFSVGAALDGGSIDQGSGPGEQAASSEKEVVSTVDGPVVGHSHKVLAGLLGLSLGALFLVGINYVYPWKWLTSNPNGYGLQACMFCGLVIAIVGAFVREWSKFLWLTLLPGVVFVLLQILGGPKQP